MDRDRRTIGGRGREEGEGVESRDELSRTLPEFREDDEDPDGEGFCFGGGLGRDTSFLFTTLCDVGVGTVLLPLIVLGLSFLVVVAVVCSRVGGWGNCTCTTVTFDRFGRS